MYCNPAKVRALIRNVRTAVSDESIEVSASLVETEIDAVLTSKYFWPSDSGGNLIAAPEYISAISTFKVAALIESQEFSVNEAGQASPNPYAMSLKRQGDQMLKMLSEFSVAVPGLQRRDTPQSEPGSTFSPCAVRSGRHQ